MPRAIKFSIASLLLEAFDNIEKGREIYQLVRDFTAKLSLSLCSYPDKLFIFSLPIGSNCYSDNMVPIIVPSISG